MDSQKGKTLLLLQVASLQLRARCLLQVPLYYYMSSCHSSAGTIICHHTSVWLLMHWTAQLTNIMQHATSKAYTHQSNGHQNTLITAPYGCRRAWPHSVGQIGCAVQPPRAAQSHPCETCRSAGSSSLVHEAAMPQEADVARNAWA